MQNKKVYLGIDVGQRRIGLAYGDSVGRIAQPLRTLLADGTEEVNLHGVIEEIGATDLVVGRPRNQTGDLTAQTRQTEKFASKVLMPLDLNMHWQDESVTSVIAEQRLKSRKKPYTKADIDSEAATIILQDYLDNL